MTDFQFPTDSSPGTNRSAPIRDCPTCGGDRFVAVRLRSPEQMTEHGVTASKTEFHEEVAPCPDCNPTEVTYWTLGKQFRSMDPATVRQALTQ